MSSEEDNKDINDDLAYTRDTFYDLIKQGKSAIDEMAQLASEMEHPKAYEALGNIIKHISDINSKFGEFNNKRNKENNSHNHENIAIDKQQNNIYIGTTKDVLKVLSEDKKKTNIEEVKDAEVIDAKVEEVKDE